MFNDYPIIICGSGNSISDGIQYELFDILKNHITIGLNYWYKYAFEPTFTSFVDWQFYHTNLNDLEKLELIIGKYEPQLRFCRINKKDLSINLLKQNTIVLPKHNAYFGKDSWKIWERLCLNCRYEYTDDFQIPKPDKCPKCGRKQIHKFGFYHGQLTGLFSLTLAIALGFKNIFLLGFDCCEYNGKTHFYQDKVNLDEKDQEGRKIFHGVGILEHTNGKKEYRTTTYNNVKNLNEKWYKPYEQELHDVNIVNVSIPSKINIFPKINYAQFFEKLGNNKIDQTEVRKEIKNFINEKIK